MCKTNVKYFLEHLGYRVSINNPYKGMELLRRYGDPVRNRHSLQIEISKALYLNEETNEPSKGFSELKNNLNKLIGFMREHIDQTSLPLAAD